MSSTATTPSATTVSTATTTSATTAAAQTRLIRPTRWWILLVAAVILFTAIYILAVLTPTGQSFENAALRGADQVGQQGFNEANRALGQITIWSLIIATALVGLIGLLRRQFLLAVIGVGVIGAGQIITQSLKRFILPRPELVPVTGDFTANSLPSGHTTIAMTVLIALFLVVPYRFRGVVMLFVSGWAVGIGAYTVTAKWHRLSDTIAADLVALAVGSVAALILLRLGRLRRVGRRPRLRMIVVVFLALSGMVALLLGVVLATSPLNYPLHSPVIEWNVYLAAHSLASAGSVFALLTYWGTWRGIEVVRRVGK
ncbi:phosphatase PAP2 family protein [Leucobacter insecticola]|uniref:Phosphatase PAP2 family protein n=1 Tax=Leucobacter insecticola TaxID=2714934 RepID=A0A6G8FHW6_9MICO|nr:phosphatase PAP2 family protein [Leucobacter insecticola]QIM15632.1 phosphatase PAP2 family protein [Leucobacter insecticola]